MSVPVSLIDCFFTFIRMDCNAFYNCRELQCEIISLGLDRSYAQNSWSGFNKNLISDILSFGGTLSWCYIYLQIIHSKMALGISDVTAFSQRRLLKSWK